jgi:metal-responsive CopG/Arc/MetJ family transcriptional regulator
MTGTPDPFTVKEALLGSVIVNAKKYEPAVRFSISLPGALAKELDQMARQKGYENRSWAVADMIQAHLVEHWQNFSDEEIADELIAAKVVKHGKLTVTTTGRDLPA